MNRVLVLVLAVGASSGCLAGSGAYYDGGGTYVAYDAAPPAEVDVDLYTEPRDGYVFINGHYNWTGGRWVWTNGYWDVDRPGYAYVQGYWQGNRWYNGRWERGRQGYVHTGGYWQPRGRGHVWVNGTWERQRPNETFVRGRWSNTNGVRSYDRGRWQRGSATSRDRSGGDRSPVIRDHRR